jgi:hypothetical protein
MHELSLDFRLKLLDTAMVFKLCRVLLHARLIAMVSSLNIVVVQHIVCVFLWIERSIYMPACTLGLHFPLIKTHRSEGRNIYVGSKGGKKVDGKNSG